MDFILMMREIFVNTKFLEESLQSFGVQVKLDII